MNGWDRAIPAVLSSCENTCAPEQTTGPTISTGLAKNRSFLLILKLMWFPPVGVRVFD